MPAPLNQCSLGKNARAPGLEVLKGIGLEMAPVVVHWYDVHRQASAMARVAQELEPNSTAADEIRKLV